ncbi:MAG: LptF/LptG family permease, partial [Candidatus Aminicenantes bacterium]|nr:LptF/LptG family permease [Candidatus Aminicenantes bacterium]
TKGVPLKDVLFLLLFLMPSVLAFTLPMSVAVGILAGLSRLSSDSEIIAFKTLGVGYKRLLRPVLIFAFLGFAATSFLTLYLTPHANYRWVQMFRKSVLSRVQLNIKPRTFNESIQNAVIYIQDIDNDDKWRNIFVYFSEPREEPKVIFAKSGELNIFEEEKNASLVLHNGVLHTYPLSEPEKYRVTTFRTLEEDLPLQGFFAPRSDKKGVREKDIKELNRDVRLLQTKLAEAPDEPPNKAAALELRRNFISHWIEIHKKFALPFSCFIFALLGLPLGASTRKGGRTSGFTISIGIILVYYILITAGEQLAMDGKISPLVGMWGPNIFFALVGLYLFVKSVRETSPFSSLIRLFKRKDDHATSTSEEAARYPLRVTLPFPNILDRYILRKYLTVFLMAFISMIFIFAIVTFFDRIGSLYEHNKPMSMLFAFIWHKLPEFIRYVLPVTALVSTLLCLGLLTKFNETTALKACGVSLYRIVVPVLFMGILVSFFSLYIQETVFPFSNKKAEEIWFRINDVPPRTYRNLDRRWVLSRDGTKIYNYGYFDQAASAFSRLTVYEIDPREWALKRRIFSEKGYLQDSGLLLTKAWYRTFESDRPVLFEKKDEMVLSDMESMNYFFKDWKEPDQMNYGELGSYIREIEEKNFSTVRFKVDLQYKTSFPIVAFVVTLLGIPFAFSMGKKGTLVGLGLSMGIVIIYWGAIGIFKSLGYVNYLSPFWASWGPNLLFGLLGLYFVFRLRT